MTNIYNLTIGDNYVDFIKKEDNLFLVTFGKKDRRVMCGYYDICSMLNSSSFIFGDDFKNELEKYLVRSL